MLVYALTSVIPLAATIDFGPPVVDARTSTRLDHSNEKFDG
jgi:hypothetical protein